MNGTVREFSASPSRLTAELDEVVNVAYSRAGDALDLNVRIHI